MDQDAALRVPLRRALADDPAARRRDRTRPWTYGPDLIDQWKARAFQQRPGGETPCCGYEDEVVNWGGSSIIMGVRAGPVRVIRATWGADSGTNIVRTEIFYRDEIRQATYLRVHPIPPFDGIYSQWDYNAGKIWQYYNPWVPDGVVVDGRTTRCSATSTSTSAPTALRFRGPGRSPAIPATGSCGGDACIDNDIDVVDPTVSGPHGALSYEQVTGPYGTARVALLDQATDGGYRAHARRPSRTTATTPASTTAPAPIPAPT